jgi:hypothetical protein
MRVDETRIPSGEQVKIRCPHCGAVAEFRAQSGPAAPASPQTETAAEQPKPSLDPADHTIPSDAFQNFRFPAEQGRKANPAKRMSKRKGWLVLIIASIIWVALFALTVNLILFFKPFTSSGVEMQTPTTTQRNR